MGDGKEQTPFENFITVTYSMVVRWEGEHSIEDLIKYSFPNIDAHGKDPFYIVDRAILAPTNNDVDFLNDKILQIFSGKDYHFFSLDKVVDDNRILYPLEYLNSISPNGMPPHTLILNTGAPIMLLRNIDPKVGLFNGIRLTCIDFEHNVIFVEVLTGQFRGTRTLIPRI